MRGESPLNLINIINPTVRPLEFVVSLFNEDGTSEQCIRDKIVGNGLRSIDIRKLEPRAPIRGF